MSFEKFSLEKVLSVHRWTNTLFSFTMTRPSHFKFTAGQFARIGLKVGDELVRGMKDCAHVSMAL